MFKPEKHGTERLRSVIACAETPDEMTISPDLTADSHYQGRPFENAELRRAYMNEKTTTVPEQAVEKAGWEVEGFIDRLTRRDDSNSERLVLEAIRHLRAFSRDCDALRESFHQATAEIERLQGVIENMRTTLALGGDP